VNVVDSDFILGGQYNYKWRRHWDVYVEDPGDHVTTMVVCRRTTMDL